METGIWGKLREESWGGDCLWDPQETGIWDKLGEESWGDGLWDTQETEGEEDCSWCPVAGLEMRLGDGSLSVLFLTSHT